MARPSRLVLAVALTLGVGCTIYNSSLLLGGDGGGDGPLGDSPPGGPCKSGTHECKDKAISRCVDGKWVVEQMCSNGCGADGGCIENPSCTGGGPGADQACGPKSNTDCCAALPVPAGTYLRSGADGEAATLGNFGLDQFEVTVGRYRKFVNAGFGTRLHPPAEGAGANPHVPGSGWSSAWNTSLSSSTSSLETSFTCAFEPTWTPSSGNTENLPMNCLTWYEAFAFCVWDGGRLPSEAEWNYAAAGGAENRYYPWSSPADAQYISPSYAAYDCTGHNGGPPMFFGDAGDGGQFLSCVIADVLPVGSRPMGNGRWGHADLAGNMAEWTADWVGPYPHPCDNCEVIEAGVTEAGPERVYRGGGFYYDPLSLATWYRLAMPPGSRDDSYGVRCARD